MPAHRNPVDDKTRGARKRYGARAALWGLLTALYAAGRDHEAQQLQDKLLLGRKPDDVLDQALRLPDLGRTGEGLVGWAAHRYHLAEHPGGTDDDRRFLEVLLPRAAYSVMEWSQRARPRPNLFDMSVEEAYGRARRFLDSREMKLVRQGPVVHRFDDGWTVQELNTKPLLVDEGNHQHICVGQEQHGYPERVLAGEIKIYSLRDPTGKPHVTLTWCAKRGLYEAATEHNGTVENDDLRNRCVTFGRSLGMKDIYLIAAGFLPATRVDLSGADLSGADLSDLNLAEAVLCDANLSKADLEYSHLLGANLRGANLRRANLIGANLRRANLLDASLRGADLRGSNLSVANLRGANLSGANLSGANLRDADLNSADLRGADLTYTNLGDASMVDSYFSRAKYNQQTKWPKDFDPVAAGAVLSED